MVDQSLLGPPVIGEAPEVRNDEVDVRILAGQQLDDRHLAHHVVEDRNREQPRDLADLARDARVVAVHLDPAEAVLDHGLARQPGVSRLRRVNLEEPPFVEVRRVGDHPARLMRDPAEQEPDRNIPAIPVEQRHQCRVPLLRRHLGSEPGRRRRHRRPARAGQRRQAGQRRHDRVVTNPQPLRGQLGLGGGDQPAPALRMPREEHDIRQPVDVPLSARERSRGLHRAKRRLGSRHEAERVPDQPSEGAGLAGQRGRSAIRTGSEGGPDRRHLTAPLSRM